MKRCDMCGKFRKHVSMEPSRKQLIFGGFRHRMEWRCGGCEKKVALMVSRMIRETDG